MTRRRKPPAPYVLTAEIGEVDESTVAVTFDQAVASSDYLIGVTIKVNGTPASIDTAERQENHAVVYYVLDDPVEAGDVLLWEYLDGLIAAEDDGVSLPGLVQPVTNNVEEEEADPIGDTLRADLKAYWKMDEASGTRADATGNNHGAAQVGGTTSGVAGKVGNAARFTGVSGRCLQCAAHADLRILTTRDFYLALWVRLTDKSTTQIILDSEDTVSEFLEEYRIMYDHVGDKFQWYASGNDPVQSAAGVNINTFYLLEVYFDHTNEEIGIAVNGGSFTTLGVTPTEMFFDDTTLFFGDVDFGSAAMTGDQDEIPLLHRIPTTDERAHIYNGGAGRTLYP